MPLLACCTHQCAGDHHATPGPLSLAAPSAVPVEIHVGQCAAAFAADISAEYDSLARLLKYHTVQHDVTSLIATFDFVCLKPRLSHDTVNFLLRDQSAANTPLLSVHVLMQRTCTLTTSNLQWASNLGTTAMNACMLYLYSSCHVTL